MEVQCDVILQKVSTRNNVEELTALVDELEVFYFTLEQVLTDLEKSQVRFKIDSLTELVLEEKPVQVIKDAFKQTLEYIRGLNSSSAQAVIQQSLINWIDRPDKISVDVDYSLPHSNLELVLFEAHAAKDFVVLNKEYGQKLLRGLLKGFVAPKSGSGIVRMTDVHKNFIEVKGLPSLYRLLGCIEGNRLRIKKVYHKRNEGAGGSLATFSSLCK